MLSECLKESGLKLPESDVREMADALYEEAIGEVNKFKKIFNTLKFPPKISNWVWCLGRDGNFFIIYICHYSRVMMTMMKSVSSN